MVPLAALPAGDPAKDLAVNPSEGPADFDEDSVGDQAPPSSAVAIAA